MIHVSILRVLLPMWPTATAVLNSLLPVPSSTSFKPSLTFRKFCCAINCASGGTIEHQQVRTHNCESRADGTDEVDDSSNWIGLI
mmetsp:Transcript_15760/g.26235  ORF Transcript_15760/g.26235 Transcript_15760/m.26235 type:complete len:85 (-) Transcript_15760:768-1022(-)